MQVNSIKKTDIILLTGLSLMVTLPFINQAFYIDDFIYLDAAVLYNQLGFDSFKGMSDQEGYLLPNYYFTHPLVWPWFLSIFIKVFNTTSEAAFHLMGIVNILITAFSSLLICKRFSKAPLAAAAIFILMPGVVLLSHTVMTDIPTLAFFLLALSFHIEGIERDSKWLLIASGFAAAISCGISYQALFITALLIFYNLQRKEKRFFSYIPVIIPFFFFLIWFLYTWREFGIPHPLVSFMWGDFIARNLLDDFFPKLAANINALGAASVFPFFILIIYGFSRFRKLIVISAAVSIISRILFAEGFSFIQTILFIVYFTAGFLLVLRMIFFLKDGFKEKENDKIFLALWFTVFFTAVIILMPLGIARYMLPGLLPLVIVVVDDIKNFFNQAGFKKIIWTGLISTAVWSAVCSVADYKTADTYRDVTKQMKLKFKGETIWFSTDGLQWYMERENYKPLLYGDTRPVKGDLVVKSRELWPYYVEEVMERTELVEVISYDWYFPVRTMNQVSHAGFHDHYHGLLPVVITREAVEKFYIYMVTK